MRFGKYFLAVGAAAGTVAGISVWGQESRDGLEIVRVTQADGRRGDLINLSGVARFHAGAEKQVRAALREKLRATVDPPAAMRAYHSGLPSCRMATRHSKSLEEELPAAFRGMSFYLVRIPRGGGRPSILPMTLPRNVAVLALDVERPGDLGKLSEDLGVSVTLVSGQMAKALGVSCSDACVEIGMDGRTLTIQEGPP